MNSIMCWTLTFFWHITNDRVRLYILHTDLGVLPDKICILGLSPEFFD